MDAISYSSACANLAGTMNLGCKDHTVVIITRQGQGAVVMMSM